MRVLGVTETCDLGSLYCRLISEGHEVRVSISHPLAQQTMAGLVPRCGDWRDELQWVRDGGADGLILFEAVGFGELQDELRAAGYNVVGGSAFGDRLESDRAFAQELLGELGLQTSPTLEFETSSGAVADLKERPRRCVFKLSASAGETFVGEFSDGSDVVALLEGLETVEERRFVLMDHVEGVEIGVGAYFNGERFLQPACLDWEHKRFFPGDLGELTGEMGTVATYQGSEDLFAATLNLTAPKLREAGHVGYVNLNMIVNETGVWPLEFTCRFGYPGFAVLEAIQDLGWGELFRRLVAKSSVALPVKSGWAVAVVLSTPPFPWSREELDSPVGLPVRIGELAAGDIHWGEVGLAAGKLVTTGLYGWTAVATGGGATIREAQEQAYRVAGQVRVPNLRYRHDIGDKLIKSDFEALVALGWLKSMPSSLMASQIVR